MSISPYVVSGAAVFLGAFLLFAIQPMTGKLLLPFFGGSSSVWATSLVFFTGMLFFGYLYVYVLTKFRRRVQIIFHLFLVAIALLLALVPLSTMLDTESLINASLREMPALGVLFALFLLIGVPFFVLSATAPLIQYWYGTATGNEPYVLYALSNAASLLALLSYPFLIEPYTSLPGQRSLWLFLFVAYVLVCVVSAVRYFRTSEVAADVHRKSHVSVGKAAFWLLLPALPSFMLVSVTTQITQTIAPVPLLWVLPLALYLLTFIIAFRGWGQSIFTPLLFFAAACTAWWFTPASYDDIVLAVASYVTLLFFTGLACHVILYQSRPGAANLPFFYLLVSLGGALGALAASMLAPLVFSDYWEFPIAIAAAAAFATWILPLAFFPRVLSARYVRLTKVFFIGFVISPLTLTMFLDQDPSSISSRNFYGNAEVRFGSDVVSLYHGTTLHGNQFTDPADARLPTTYYTPGSGIGRAILYAESANEVGPIRLGMIGLGSGTVAAYCREGDTYVFYEIDARMEHIARSYFSYVPRCDGAEVRIGDGRILLEEERQRGMFGAYDVLAVDAFSDDTIPVHLLTLQAIELYVSHLRRDDSILAVHISNRYLDLSPIVFRLAAEVGLNAMIVSDSGDTGAGGNASSWVVLAKDAEVFGSTAFANTDSWVPTASEHIWTDDYSSLLPVIDVAWPWE